MQPKPSHLAQHYGDQFADPGIVAAYHFRPPYPPDVFDTLKSLVDKDVPTVLDVGCGTGELAREMVKRGFRVDAVDPSPGMIEKGRELAGGDISGLTWILGKAEEVQLSGPYGLITTGASLHWMEWDVVLPRFGDLLSARGLLAVVDQYQLPVPWESDKSDLCRYFSTNREWRPYDVVDELVERDLYEVLGQHKTTAIPFTQSLADYVESFHSRNGFSRDRMAGADAESFDRELASLVRSQTGVEEVHLDVAGTIVWGLPKQPAW